MLQPEPEETSLTQGLRLGKLISAKLTTRPGMMTNMITQSDGRCREARCGNFEAIMMSNFPERATCGRQMPREYQSRSFHTRPNAVAILLVLL